MSLVFRFGVPESFVGVAPEGGLSVGVACPVLGGSAEERWPVGTVLSSGEEGGDGAWRWVTTDRFLVGAVAAPVSDATLEATTLRLYTALFAKVAGRHLYRVWHFVPGITRVAVDGLENYHRFCRARAEAFGSAFKGAPEVRMPAASATGVDSDRLVIVVLAGDVPPEHFENPDQTPAYRYPARYGPNPPSFARATRVRFPDTTWTFISGTAAIRGSDSLHAGDPAAQARVTAENLSRMLAIAGVVGDSGEARVFARCYVRDASDVACASLAFPSSPPGGCHPVVLSSDVCRSELRLESEVTVVSPLKS